MTIWKKPFYTLTADNGQPVVIDVTLSVNPALGPNKAIYEVIEFFKRKNVKTIVDFGAGALRHTLPLLAAGFQVCAVDFAEQYEQSDSKRVCFQNIQTARNDPNFCTLIYPSAFIDDHRRFDAALLCYTFQGMPIQKERERVLKVLYDKLKKKSYVVWMSRFGDAKSLPSSQAVNGGHFKNPTANTHSFYKEFPTEQVHEMMDGVSYFKHFHLIQTRPPLGKGGKDQLYVYSKTKNDKWV